MHGFQPGLNVGLDRSSMEQADSGDGRTWLDPLLDTPRLVLRSLINTHDVQGLPEGNLRRCFVYE